MIFDFSCTISRFKNKCHKRKVRFRSPFYAWTYPDGVDFVTCCFNVTCEGADGAESPVIKHLWVTWFVDTLKLNDFSRPPCFYILGPKLRLKLLNVKHTFRKRIRLFTRKDLKVLLLKFLKIHNAFLTFSSFTQTHNSTRGFCAVLRLIELLI